MVRFPGIYNQNAKLILVIAEKKRKEKGINLKATQRIPTSISNWYYWAREFLILQNSKLKKKY